MRITCTGPNGEKFEGEASLVKGGNLLAAELAEQHNSKERAAIQQALETWCKAVKAKPEEAKVTP